MTRPLRVVVDATQIDNQNLGSGQYRYTADLLSGLAAEPDVRLTVLTSRRERPERFPSGPEYVCFTPLGGRGYYYRDLARLSWWLGTHGADVFHELHTNVPPWTFCPVVATVYHYFEDTQLFSTRPYRYYQWALRHRVDTIITISNATRDAFHAHLGVPLDRMRTIYLGLSHSLQPGAAPPGRRYILSPYNLSLSKNLRALVLAWPTIAAAASELELWLYGRPQVTPESEAAFDALVRELPHGDRIRRVGPIDDATLSSLFAGCALFVFPTTVEGFGYPLLEAMAHGACCVTRNASAMKEVGADAVTLVETRSPVEIAAAVTTLLADPDERRRLGARARARAELFTVERMIRDTLTTYAAVAAGQHPSGPAVL